MTKTDKNYGWKLSIYQLVESFDANEANINMFVSNKTKITGPVVVQVRKANEQTTWVLLGANDHPELIHVD